MIKKILEALKQKYQSKYGLKDSDWSEIATTGAALITDEEQIPKFIEGAETIVKRVQSLSDSIVTLKAKVEKPVEKPLEKPNNEPNPPTDELSKAILEELKQARKDREADKAVIETLQIKLSAIESKELTGNTISQAKALFDANPALKEYKAEGEDAWERALEIFEATGSKANAEELSKNATSYFDKYASRKGYDTATYVASEGSQKPSMMSQYLAGVKEKDEAAKKADEELAKTLGLEDEE